MFLLLLSPASAAEKASVGPSSFEAFLLPGRHDSFTLSVERERGAFSYLPADIVFLIDATGSMRNIIQRMQAQAVEVLHELRLQNHDTAFGVASFGDYPMYGGAEPVWTLDQDVTEDADRVVSALHNMHMADGGDLPEAYSRALYEMLFLHWRPGAKRYVVLFGDAPAHDPEFYGRDFGIDPGRDGISGTGDDLRFREVVRELAMNKITVISIYDRGPWYSRKSLGEETRKGFEYVARETSGIAVPVMASAEIASAIRRGFGEIRPPVPMIRPTGPYAGWVSAGSGRPADSKGLGYRFPITVTAPEGTAAGHYEIPLRVMAGTGADAGAIGLSTVSVRVGWFYYPWRWLLLGLLALLAALALRGFAGRGRRGAVAARMLGRAAEIGLLWRALLIPGGIVALIAVLTLLPGSLGELLGR